MSTDQVVEERGDSRDDHIVEMWTPLKLDIDGDYAFIRFSPFFRAVSFLVYLFFCIIFTVWNTLFYRERVVGRENLKTLRGKGFITVANHCHYLDTVMIAQKLFPRTIYFPTAQRNFQVPFLRTLLRLLRSFPIPDHALGFKMILSPLGEALRRNKIIHFFPEGDLWHLHQGIDDTFKRGAFYLSHIHNVPVVPMVLEFSPMLFRGGPIGKNWITVKLHIGKPIYPDKFSESEHDIDKSSVDRMIKEANSWMKSVLETA